jgi:hypothetical protein
MGWVAPASFWFLVYTIYYLLPYFILERKYRFKCFSRSYEKVSAGEVWMVDVTPMEFLEAVYCNEELPLTVRMRAAIECLPYKHPKAPQHVLLFDGQTFAQALDRCIERSSKPVPMLNGPVNTLPLEEAKQPMARYRRY